MKYCLKCEIHRPEADSHCSKCGVILVSDPKNSDEKLMMSKVIVKELNGFIQTCAELRKEHEPNIGAIISCPFCMEIASSRLPELFDLIVNGKNGKITIPF